MWKLFFSALLGALCGALLTAVALLQPFTNSVDKPQIGSSSIESTGPASLLAGTAQTQQKNEQGLLSELQQLLEILGDARRTSPAVDAQLKRLFNALVLADPIATALLIDDTESLHRWDLLDQFLGVWVKRHRLELLNTLPASWPESRPRLYRGILQNLGNSYPEETLAHVLALPPSDLRPELMINIAHAIDVNNLPSLFVALEELTDNEQLRFVKWDSFILANKAPQQLFNWSSNLSEPQRSLGIQTALEGLARLDPKTTLERVDEQSVNNKRGILRSALRKLAATEPRLAVTEAEARGGFFVDVATVWAYREPEAATRWLIQQTPEQRNSSHDPLLNIAHTWSKRDLNAALAFADTLPEDLRAGWTSAVAAQLEVTDIDRLETLAQTLSDTPYAADMYTRLASRRYDSDPKGTLTQVLGLTPELRDKPLSSLIDQAMYDTPDTAANLIDQISDSELRMRSLRTVLSNWQQREDGAMERWLTNEASPSLRDEAYATMAQSEPRLLTSIKSREMRVATYLGINHRSRSAAGVNKLLAQIDLSEAQWASLDSAAIAAATPTQP